MVRVIEGFVAEIERHRRFQIVITTGITTATVIAVFWPEYERLATTVGVVTNLIWIWE